MHVNYMHVLRFTESAKIYLTVIIYVNVSNSIKLNNDSFKLFNRAITRETQGIS